MSRSSRLSSPVSLLHILIALLLISLALAQNQPPRETGQPAGAAPTRDADETNPAGRTPPGRTPATLAPVAPPGARPTSESEPQTTARPSRPEDEEEEEDEQDESTSEAERTSEATGTSEAESTSEAEPTTESERESETETETETERPRQSSTAVITPTITGPSSTANRPPPATITGGGSSASSGGRLPSGLPTLSGAFSYPPPSVPPTAKAPFMQQSSLPEGTVFIVVGATLGFLGFSVLAWRGLVAWSVHRSVKRAAMEQTMADSKVMLRPRGHGFYAAGAGSTHSLDHLSSNPRLSTSGRKSHLSNSGNLFYSPTARTMSGLEPLAGNSNNNNSNRGSAYLPGGYYPMSNAAPAGGAATVHLGTPSSHSRVRSRGTSPPPSPSLSPGRGVVDPTYARHSTSASAAGAPIIPSHASTSSLNLSVPPAGRAPSAYLEDLFESHQLQPTRPSQDRF